MGVLSPVVLYILYLAIRHRSLTLFTAANPAIPGGGFVGESKGAILQGLAHAPEQVARWELIPASLPGTERLSRRRVIPAAPCTRLPGCPQARYG